MILIYLIYSRTKDTRFSEFSPNVYMHVLKFSVGKSAGQVVCYTPDSVFYIS